MDIDFLRSEVAAKIAKLLQDDQMPSLCATFRKEAGIVWHRMTKASQLGLALSEETITECVLYNIALAHQGEGIVVDLATKSAEAKHGADWEWWFTKGNKGRCFRVQAKRLFPGGAYNSLFKSTANPYQQLDKLVAISGKAGFEPLYCFYNFVASPYSMPVPNLCQHHYYGRSFWGCSLAFPEVVKQARSNKLVDLKQYMYPWHYLVCGVDEGDALPASTGRFVMANRNRDALELQSVPDRVLRLVELGQQRREFSGRSYLDYEYWTDGSMKGNELAGLVVFRDER
jgi:hypothetical protein